jgi:hypothetical protein
MSNSVLVEFRLMSSVASNRCPFRTFIGLENRIKLHGARAGEMAAAATEECRVWPKTTAHMKCVRLHCRGAWSSSHPAIFPVVFGELFHANVARHPGRIPCFCLPLGCVLVVYDTLRIKNASNMTFYLFRTWRPFSGRGDLHSDDCCFVSGRTRRPRTRHVSVADFPILK